MLYEVITDVTRLATMDERSRLLQQSPELAQALVERTHEVDRRPSGGLSRRGRWMLGVGLGIV